MMRTNHRVGRRFLLAALVVGLAAGSGFAQIKRVLPFDILDQIQNKKASVTVVPSTGADSTKPFDGNPFTEFALHTADSLVVTLAFDTLVSVEKSKVFLWNGGVWSLEGADSLADLVQKKGSYVLISDSRPYSLLRLGLGDICEAGSPLHAAARAEHHRSGSLSWRMDAGRDGDVHAVCHLPIASDDCSGRQHASHNQSGG